MISVPIRYRRAERGLFIQKLQHAIPSVVVLGDGLSHLSHNPRGMELALGVFEVGAAVAVIGSVIHGVRKLVKGAPAPAAHAHHGPDWIDIFIGIMLGVEAYAKYHSTHHIPRPTVLLAVTMVGIGLAHGRIAAWGDRRRLLIVDADGITIPTKPFGRYTLAWPEVASIEVGDRVATVTALSGRHQKFDLTDLQQPNAVREALMAARTFLDESQHAASASIESTTPTA